MLPISPSAKGANPLTLTTAPGSARRGVTRNWAHVACVRHQGTGRATWRWNMAVPSVTAPQPWADRMHWMPTR